MEQIMEQYSTTFYKCMEKWPIEIKEDVYKLYAYLRVCDEVVEGMDIWESGEKIDIVNQFNLIVDKYQMEQEWVDDFHHAMLTDLHKRRHTVVSMLEYCKGSAEAVGLMMSRILGCPPEADHHARALGRAYQIINFMRDYEEDVDKGYHYITDNFSAYLEIFYQDIDNGMDGLGYIPTELQQPIIQATQGYMEIAKGLE